MPWAKLRAAFDRQRPWFFADNQRDRYLHDLLRTIEITSFSM